MSWLDAARAALGALVRLVAGVFAWKAGADHVRRKSAADAAEILERQRDRASRPRRDPRALVERMRRREL